MEVRLHSRGRACERPTRAWGCVRAYAREAYTTVTLNAIVIDAIVYNSCISRINTIYCIKRIKPKVIKTLIVVIVLLGLKTAYNAI